MNLTMPQCLVYDMERFYGGAISTICGSTLFSGTVDDDRIQMAINRIIENNDVLRTRICENDGVPCQITEKYVYKTVDILNFRDEDSLSKYCESLAKKPMDLYGNLFCCYGVKLAEKYGLIVKIHHIISDAWTLSLIATQFASILNGVDITEYSYSDFVHTERQYIESDHFENDKRFWLNTFSKCDEPVYISEAVTKDVSAKRMTFVVGKDDTCVISDYSKSNSSSMFVVLLTAISAYFSRIKLNCEKFYIGTAVLNRKGKKEKNTMGMYVNTIPLLIELDNDKTFEDNMSNIASNIISAFRHQRFNYQKILETIRNEYKFSDKLYDVMFSYQNAKIVGDKSESAWYHCGSQTESLQIHIDDRDDEGTLTVHYDYHIDKFTEAEICRMHEHIFNILFDAIECSEI